MATGDQVRVGGLVARIWRNRQRGEMREKRFEKIKIKKKIT